MAQWIASLTLAMTAYVEIVLYTHNMIKFLFCQGATILERITIPVRHRIAAVAAKGFGGDFGAGRGLIAFIFGAIQQLPDAHDRVAVIFVIGANIINGPLGLY